jgi:hypothetical protein
LQAVEVWPFEKAPYLRGVPPVNGQTVQPDADGAIEAASLQERDPSTEVHVKLLGDVHDARRLARLRELVLDAAGGSCRIVLHAGSTPEDRASLRQSVRFSTALRNELADVFGGENVWEAPA